MNDAVRVKQYVPKKEGKRLPVGNLMFPDTISTKDTTRPYNVYLDNLREYLRYNDMSAEGMCAIIQYDWLLMPIVEVFIEAILSRSNVLPRHLVSVYFRTEDEAKRMQALGRLMTMAVSAASSDVAMRAFEMLVDRFELSDEVLDDMQRHPCVRQVRCACRRMLSERRRQKEDEAKLPHS